LLRPAVVWFEEMLPDQVWSRAQGAVERCQVLLVVGTSAVVYPAAGLIDSAKSYNAKVIEVYLAATSATSSVDIALHGESGKILPDLVQRL
jgi:NAD-dependent deacetylase